MRGKQKYSSLLLVGLLPCLMVLCAWKAREVRGVVGPLQPMLGGRAGAVVVNSRFRSNDAVLGKLLHAEVMHCGFEPDKMVARRARGWQLYKLWLVQYRRDVTAQVIPFLQDEYPPLRNQAVRLLGRTANPQAAAALEAQLPTGWDARTTAPCGGHTQIALARLRSRGFTGARKLSRFAGDLGLSWPQIVRLSELVAAKGGKARDSAGRHIMWETIDILYVMAKRGEDIGPFAQRLTLHPAQRILLQNAHLPPAQEATALVEYLAKLDVYTVTDAQVGDFYLPALDTFATQAILQRLAMGQSQTVKWGKYSYVPLLQHIANCGDVKALAYIKGFATSSHPILRDYGQRARGEQEKAKKLKAGTPSPFLAPAAPLMFT